jgi:hypothetical protein
MKRLMRNILIFLSFLVVLPVFADDNSGKTPEPYKDDEFPQFMKDARRAEIITLGAMPFVTLNTTLGYSVIRYCQNDFSSDYIPNPFAKSSASNGFTEDEQKTILLTSVGISVGIGLTDLIVNLIKRDIKKKKLLKEKTGPILITPVDQDADAVRIEMPPPRPEKENETDTVTAAVRNDEAENK